MATLLMRIEAPLQSWGISSHFTERDSAREPSKSGIIGLICAAMGRGRDADLADLAALRMGVRVDREGILEKDFQTARNVLKADGSNAEANIISNRYYLADAVFLVGLEGEKALLEEIQEALKTPRWAIFFGRKAFPPGEPVILEDGLKEGMLESELRGYRSLVTGEDEDKRLVIEASDGEFRRHDVPNNFAERRFSYRRVKILGQQVGKKEEDRDVPFKTEI